uniref:Uncharacterized protein n=1 Tax=Strigamia maritima TaxID=126957 RepID=T1JB92_STRMM
MLQAYRDPVLLGDERILQNLLHCEDKYAIRYMYFKCVQKDIKEYMRKMVAMWMLEICEEQRCQSEVFPLAMNYMDRFLSVVGLQKSQLQLLGAVCLFLSSKLKETRPLSAEQLCMYTDNSISLSELQAWELLVLNKLKWDLSAITAYDFLDHILLRMPHIKENEMIRSHAQTFITLCATEFKFSMSPPSMIAAASIGAAVRGLTLPNQRWSSMRDLLLQLHSITGIEVDCLRECLEQIEEMVNTSLDKTSPALLPTSAPNSSVTAKVVKGDADHYKSETPTDVRDIHF